MAESGYVERLAPLVNRPEWDNFMVYLTNKSADLHERLETCPIESLKGIQGQLSVIKDMLALRDTVNSVINQLKR